MPNTAPPPTLPAPGLPGPPSRGAAVLRGLGAWLLASAWGSVVQTQFNLQALAELPVAGAGLTPGLRLATTLQDLLHFGPLFGGLVLAGGLPALALAAWLAPRLRAVGAARTGLFALAALLGVIAAVRCVDAVAPMPVFIDATRSSLGLLLVCAGAALGGAWLGRPRARS